MNIKKPAQLLPFFGLALMLLLSPCKVRNFVQAELNLPQTEASNKSKTTISTSNCSSFNVALNSVSESKLEFKKLPTKAAKSFELAYSTYDSVKSSVYSNKERAQAVSPIPLYILHQNFKVYL